MERVLGKDWKEDTYYLHYLATHPNHQGRGLGSALIRHVLKQVQFNLVSL
jgi:ribosomal protein S18 acetylase RimI-like enzyme